jgi:subtilisin family serine protease
MSANGIAIRCVLMVTATIAMSAGNLRPIVILASRMGVFTVRATPAGEYELLLDTYADLLSSRNITSGIHLIHSLCLSLYIPTSLNSPNYVSNSIFSHCTSLDDYVTDTCEQPENFFSDPAYSGQAWVYEMVNVESVWNQGIFGQGVRVRINDNGVDSGNIEFQDRFDTANGCDQFEPTAEELQGGAAANHGTSVASILGAAGNNGECSVGIAPEVTLSSCYVFDGTYKEEMLWDLVCSSCVLLLSPPHILFYY